MSISVRIFTIKRCVEKLYWMQPERRSNPPTRLPVAKSISSAGKNEGICEIQLHALAQLGRKIDPLLS